MPSEYQWGPLFAWGFYFFVSHPHNNPESWNFYPIVLLGRKKLKITDFKINGPRDVPLSKRSEIWTPFSLKSPDSFYYILFI